MHVPNRHRLISAGIALACCLLIAGCRDSSSGGNAPEPKEKSVADNFGKIEPGMTEQQVTDLIGPPSDGWEVSPRQQANVLRRYQLADKAGATQKMTEKTWTAGDKTFDVVFGDGRVIAKATGEVGVAPDGTRNASAPTAGSASADTAPTISGASAKASSAAIDQSPVP